MSIVISPRLSTAIGNALKWLRENPDKHIAGSLAVDINGNEVKCNDPNASCFCMLGRISKELDQPSWPNQDPDWHAEVDRSQLTLANIYSTNDRNTTPRVMVCDGVSPGNQAVLDLLESKFTFTTEPVETLTIWQTIAAWWQRVKAYF